jgi:hypothetical protein
LLGNFKVKSEKDEKKKVKCKICCKEINASIRELSHEKARSKEE